MDTVKHKAQQSEFWDKKAQVFPRYEEGDSTYEAGMLDTARSHGVVFKDADVLDIGCGSGMYTIRIAKEAKSVTATDISSEMLRILNEDAKTNGVSNIKTMLCDWTEFEADKKFDIIFCSMTPAIQSEERRAKILDYAGGYVVYMGFAGEMESNILGAVYNHYGVQNKKMHDAPVMKEWLEKREIAFTAYPVKGEWVVVNGVTADDEVLARYINPAADGKGMFVERTKYKIEMIIWHV